MIGRGPAGAGNTSVQKGQPGPRLLQAGQARFGVADAERLSVQGTVHWCFNTSLHQSTWFLWADRV